VLKRSEFSSMAISEITYKKNKSKELKEKENSSSTQTIPSQLNKRNLRISINDQVEVEPSQISVLDSRNENCSDVELKKFSLEELVKLSEKNVFPKKEFAIGGIKVFYTPVLNFFASIAIFVSKPKEVLEFKCIGCDFKTKQVLGEVTYLNRHLRIHCSNPLVPIWYQKYQARKGVKQAAISKDMLEFMLLFVTSNDSVDMLRNRHYLNILQRANIKVPGEFNFRYTVLPDIMKLVYEQIEIKLQNAESICLIVDIWTNQVSADFLGLAVVLTNSFFEREILAINMMRMPGSHDAENIKYSIEKMINFFDFDKSKAKSLYFSLKF